MELNLFINPPAEAGGNSKTEGNLKLNRNGF